MTDPYASTGWRDKPASPAVPPGSANPPLPGPAGSIASEPGAEPRAGQAMSSEPAGAATDQFAGAQPGWQQAPASQPAYGHPGPPPTGSYGQVGGPPPGGYPAPGPQQLMQHQPTSGPVPPVPVPRRSLLTVLAVVLACVLVGGSVVQTVLLVRTNSALQQQKRRAAQAHSRYDKRLKSLEDTVKALEQRANRSLDAAAVAHKVLPSIFQVVAGDYTGSSFVIGASPGGGSYLLTNDHVVQPLLDSGKKRVKLERGGGSFPATVVHHDKGLDIAVLECDQKFDSLTPVHEQVQPGEPVVVVGSPLGLNDSVTTGVVSSARRDIPGGGAKFIQFDAAINPGNSGGPVMNARGEVVGLATEKARDAEGIGLAIPIAVPCDKYSVCTS